MRLLVRIISQVLNCRRGVEPVAHVQVEPPLQLGEIMAAATVPEFADLPLEFWPGYRHLSSAANEARPQSVTPRALA